MTQQITLRDLSQYEARSLCQFIRDENKTERVKPHKIEVKEIKRFPNSTYSLVVNSPDNYPTESLLKKLSEIQQQPHGEKGEDIPLANKNALPQLHEFARVQIVSGRQDIPLG